MQQRESNTMCKIYCFTISSDFLYVAGLSASESSHFLINMQAHKETLATSSSRRFKPLTISMMDGSVVMNRIFAITDNAVAKLQNTLPMRESGHTQVCFVRLPCTHHCHDLCETIMMILRCS